MWLCQTKMMLTVTLTARICWVLFMSQALYILQLSSPFNNPVNQVLSLFPLHRKGSRSLERVREFAKAVSDWVILTTDWIRGEMLTACAHRPGMLTGPDPYLKIEWLRDWMKVMWLGLQWRLWDKLLAGLLASGGCRPTSLWQRHSVWPPAQHQPCRFSASSIISEDTSHLEWFLDPRRYQPKSLTDDTCIMRSLSEIPHRYEFGRDTIAKHHLGVLFDGHLGLWIVFRLLALTAYRKGKKENLVARWYLAISESEARFSNPPVGMLLSQKNRLVPCMGTVCRVMHAFPNS